MRVEHRKETWYLVNGAEQMETWYLMDGAEQNKQGYCWPATTVMVSAA